MSTDDTTAGGWTYDEDSDKVLDQDGFAPDMTTEQWCTLWHFIARHGPAIVAGRDPVAEAERARDEARAAVEELQSRVCVLENECAAAEQESFDSDEQARADMAKIAELEAAMAEVERLRTLCAEVYQVVAVLAGDHFDTPRVERVLDNLAAATGGEALPHENLTPFVVAGPVMPAPSERVATIAAIEDIEELATARAQRIGPMMPEEPGLVALAEIACGINNALKRGGGQTITQETRHIYRAIRAALAKEQQQ